VLDYRPLLGGRLIGRYWENYQEENPAFRFQTSWKAGCFGNYSGLGFPLEVWPFGFPKATQGLKELLGIYLFFLTRTLQNQGNSSNLGILLNWAFHSVVGFKGLATFPSFPGVGFPKPRGNQEPGISNFPVYPNSLVLLLN